MKANIRITMDKPPALDEAMWNAYRATRYRVHAPGRDLLLRVDQYDDQLAKLLREAGVQRAALLTAWNPRSKTTLRSTNEARQKQLVQELCEAGFPCLAGRNEPIDDTTRELWSEESVLVLEITELEARRVALRYDQLAYLWIDEQATPRLVAAAGAER